MFIGDNSFVVESNQFYQVFDIVEKVTSCYQLRKFSQIDKMLIKKKRLCKAI